MKTKNRNSIFPWLIALICLSLACFSFQFKKDKLVEVKDDTRILVHLNTDTIKDALDARAADWGTIDSDWSPNFFKKESGGFIIESLPGQKFYDILCADSAAFRIARDYPYLFHFKETEEGGCRFRMARKQGKDGYVVFPTWLLVELIERKVLILPQ
ncbi:MULTISPECIES: hypothetical protein [unclassified Parabacteroides]|uniref:hypothetical protein n=1 Tax=unclassified Parabacteroides TaxID=2649774 RepID=UPI0024746950|nr:MULTISPECIES: hypothetical protein [unclassified Parabacteroides]